MSISLPRVRLNEENPEVSTAFTSNHYAELNRIKDDYSDYNCGASRASTAVLRSSPGYRSVDFVSKVGNKVNVSLDEDTQSSISSKKSLLSNLDLIIVALAFSIRSLHLTDLIGSSWEFGGGVYSLARILMTWLITGPMIFFELSLGHLSGQGPYQLLQSIRPVFSGIGAICLVVCLYSAVTDAVVIMWSITQFFYNNSIISIPVAFPEDLRNVSFGNSISNFNGLEQPLVIGLTVVWVTVMITSLFGLRFIKMVSYVSVIGTISLLLILIIRKFSLNFNQSLSTLNDNIQSDWSLLIQIPVWIKSCIDSIATYRLGSGMYPLLGREASDNCNLFASTLIIAVLQSIVLGLMSVFCYSVQWESQVGLLMSVSQQFEYPWNVVFSVMETLLNISAICLVVYLFSDTLAKTKWRPVATILVCGFLFLMAAPFATSYGHLFYCLINNYGVLLAVIAVLLTLLAFFNGCGLEDLIRTVEFSMKKKIGLFPRSYFVFTYTVVLPLALIACLIFCLVDLSQVSDSMIQNVIYSLTLKPLILILVTPLFIALAVYRRTSFTKRIKRLFSNSGCRNWIMNCENHVHYELPERVAPVHFGHTNVACIESAWNR